MSRTITLRTVKGKVYKIEIEDDATIAQLKDKFRKEAAVESSELKFIYRAHNLNDDLIIKDSNIKEKDVIIVHIPKNQPKAEPAPAPAAPVAAPKPADPVPTPAPAPAPAQRPDGPTAAPLPDINAAQQAAPQEINFEELAASPEFQSALSSIQELGFPRSDCEAALKAALGDPNLAVTFLEHGHIPSEAEVRAALQNRNQGEMLIQQLQNDPSKLLDIIAAIESRDPEKGAILRANPEILIQQLGLDPSKFNLDEIKATAPEGTPSIQDLMGGMMGAPGGMMGAPGSQGEGFDDEMGGMMNSPQPRSPTEALLANYTPEEKQTINNLRDLTGQDLDIVIQVYEACNKDENMAANCLLNM